MRTVREFTCGAITPVPGDRHVSRAHAHLAGRSHARFAVELEPHSLEGPVRERPRRLGVARHLLAEQRLDGGDPLAPAFGISLRDERRARPLESRPGPRQLLLGNQRHLRAMLVPERTESPRAGSTPAPNGPRDSAQRVGRLEGGQVDGCAHGDEGVRASLPDRQPTAADSGAAVSMRPAWATQRRSRWRPPRRAWCPLGANSGMVSP